MGSYQTLELIETFINYQESIKRCICIIYDPQRTKTGGLKVSLPQSPVCLQELCCHLADGFAVTMCAMQAVKLKDAFIELYKAGPLTVEKLKLANLAWSDVFEELPVRIQNSTLAKAMLAQIEPATATQQPDFRDLLLGSGPMLLKSLDFMNELLDEVIAEQQKVGPWAQMSGSCQ